MMTTLSPLFQKSEKLQSESLLDYAARLSQLWVKSRSFESRKLKGQFFTPKEVSSFMANMFTIKTTVRLLDPGAGIGNLTAAFCDRMLKLPVRCSLIVDAYESDSEIIPALQQVLDACKIEMTKKDCYFNYNIFNQDFITNNESILQEIKAFGDNITNNALYDCIISNPPYYKLDRASPQAIIMRNFLSGHPNIYALFMVLSAKMLRENGEMVFITPRSFCSGMYYQKFRKWFLNSTCITQLHIFESRTDVFSIDNILQENILIKAIKSNISQGTIKISSSRSKAFDSYHEFTSKNSDVIFRKNGDVLIRIPSSWNDVLTLRLIDKWPNTLKDLGLEASTGPVVTFRTEKNLHYDVEKRNDSAPLIWMHNFVNKKIDWPVRKKNKPTAIYANEETKKLLLPVENYVVIGRFSFKEQKKRLNVAVLLKEDFSFKMIGLENHVNFIHKIIGELTEEETMGIAALLNTYYFDNYFRSLNGNTQVNAVDLRCLPLPSIEQIKEIGRQIIKQKSPYTDWDQTVAMVLQLDMLEESCSGGKNYDESS